MISCCYAGLPHSFTPYPHVVQFRENWNYGQYVQLCQLEATTPVDPMAPESPSLGLVGWLHQFKGF